MGRRQPTRATQPAAVGQAGAVGGFPRAKLSEHPRNHDEGGRGSGAWRSRSTADADRRPAAGEPDDAAPLTHRRIIHMTTTSTPTHTILHLSDTHILPTEDDRLHGVDTMANLRLALDSVAEHGATPDAILVSGDLANAGELESYRRLRGVLDEARARFGVPVLPVMGNHDARGPFREGLLREPASDDPDCYVTWLGGLRVIVLDSTVPGAAPGERDSTQLEWLRTELVQPAPDGTLVVLHHPPIPGPVPII